MKVTILLLAIGLIITINHVADIDAKQRAFANQMNSSPEDFVTPDFLQDAGKHYRGPGMYFVEMKTSSNPASDISFFLKAASMTRSKASDKPTRLRIVSMTSVNKNGSTIGFMVLVEDTTKDDFTILPQVD